MIDSGWLFDSRRPTASLRWPITPGTNWCALASKNMEIQKFSKIFKNSRLELENLFKWPDIWVQKGVRLEIQAFSLAINFLGEISGFLFFLERENQKYGNQEIFKNSHYDKIRCKLPCNWLTSTRRCESKKSLLGFRF